MLRSGSLWLPFGCRDPCEARLQANTERQSFRLELNLKAAAAPPRPHDPNLEHVISPSTRWPERGGQKN